MRASVKRDFTDGPIFSRMLLFTIPLIATSILQVLYNAADKLVVGRYSGDLNALAAIGSVANLNAFLVSILIGASAGAGVLAAQYYGAGKYEELSRATSTSVCFAAIGGVIFMLLGYVAFPWLVPVISTPELQDGALLYTMITAAGIPAVAVYNFGSAVVRGKGDSRTPLIIGTIAGVMNVLLNLVFVLFFDMSVDGVALATVISQYFSAVAVIVVLLRSSDGGCRALDISRLVIDKKNLAIVARLGIPAGLQNGVANFANIINSVVFNHAFASEAISAQSVSGTIDIVVYSCMGCIMQAAMTFTGQNYGARKFKRVRKVLVYGVIQVVAIGIVMGAFFNLFGPTLAEMFVDPNDPAKDMIVAISKENWFEFVTWFYAIYGIACALSGFVRGLGYSLTPALSVLFGEVGVKTIWALLVFPIFADSIRWFLTGHISGWLANVILTGIIVIIALKRLKKEEVADEREAVASIS